MKHINKRVKTKETEKPNENKTNAKKEVLGYLTKKRKKWEEKEISEMGLRQRGGDFLEAAAA